MPLSPLIGCSTKTERCSESAPPAPLIIYVHLSLFFFFLKSEKSDFFLLSAHLHVCVSFFFFLALVLLLCQTSLCVCLCLCLCSCAGNAVGMEGPMSHRPPLGPLPSAARFHRRRTSGTRDERYRSGRTINDGFIRYMSDC